MCVFKGNADAYLNHNLMRLRLPTKLVEPHFIAAVINILYNQKWLQKTGQSTATNNESKLLSLPIPLPPIEEQLRIVCALRKYLNEVKETARFLIEQRIRLSFLKQSLLKHIFKGEPE